MPVLHKYKQSNDYYVLTRISGHIITYQLSTTGREKLLQSGLKNGDKFRRAILFDLYSSGDAFTGGSGPGVIQEMDRRQLEIDFDLPEDPEPAEIFPSCSNCTSLDDLNLFVSGSTTDMFGQLFCRKCRMELKAKVLVSIPLPLVSRSVFNKLEGLTGLVNFDVNATAHKDLLDREFTQMWDDLARKKPLSKQVSLFGDDSEMGPLFKK